ncbi:hypothetical protein G9A89_006976 [Geosiphon pyriformis]|nr:hypothetical protein G9A89_006976 [Geosiphon pyriformis]
MVVYQPIPSSSNQLSGLRQQSSGTEYTQNPSSQNYLSLLVTPEDTLFNTQESKQKQPLTNILSATVTEDESLAVIFPFEIEELTETSLFSEAILEEKPIMVMYTDAKINAVSTRIITTNGATKMPISEIDALPIEVNGIIVPIKKADQVWKTDFDSEEPTTWKWDKGEKGKGKAKAEDKKLLSIGTCCGNDKEYQMVTKFYCHICVIEYFGRPRRQKKWDNESCLACGETLLDKGMWNDIPGQGRMCDTSCQYIILISNWVKKGTPIEVIWRKAVQQLDSCPHDDDEIWRMAMTKIERTLPKEIRKVKNNPPELIELDWDPEPVINLLDPEQFYKYYQELALTREE